MSFILRPVHIAKTTTTVKNPKGEKERCIGQKREKREVKTASNEREEKKQANASSLSYQEEKAIYYYKDKKDSLLEES